jgi:hypothetical protein
MIKKEKLKIIHNFTDCSKITVNIPQSTSFDTDKDNNGELEFLQNSELSPLSVSLFTTKCPN